MKILIYSQYFWPENFLINDLVFELEKKNKIDVITGLPNYPKGFLYKGYSFFSKKKENYNNVSIYRNVIIPRKKSTYLNLIINYISFLFFSFFNILFLKNKKSYDLCFLYAPSPLISLLPIFFFKKKYKLKIYLWLQDLWPKVIENKTNINFIKKIINMICKYIYLNSDRILVQSHDYKKYLIKKYNIDENKIIFFPNWSQNEKKINYEPTKRSIIKIAYLGNIGYSQNFKFLCQILSKKKLPNFEFHFYGEGRYKNEFQKIVNQNNIRNVRFDTQLEISELINQINSFDALFLSLSSEYSHTIPAKFQFYLSLGMPIIAIVDGYLNQLIKNKKIGLASNVNDFNEFENNLSNFSKLSFNDKKNIAENAYQLYQSNFTKNIAVDKFYNIVNEKNSC